MVEVGATHGDHRTGRARIEARGTGRDRVRGTVVSGRDDLPVRWSTDRWDWAMTFFDVTPTASAITALQQTLGD